MNWKKYKKQLENIVELIEDTKFPARRSITDYIEEMFGYPKEMSEYIEELYKKYNHKTK